MKLIFSLLILMFSNLVWSDIYVVTNINNPIESLTQKDVRDFYLGRRKSFSGSDFTVILDRSPDSELRAEFFFTLTGMQLRQVDAFWARLVFAGRMLPLKTVESNEDLLAMVAGEVNSIGYTKTRPNPKKVKTLLVIRAEDKQ